MWNGFIDFLFAALPWVALGLVTAAVVVKNRKKKKGRLLHTVFLCIFITVLLLAEVFTYFGGFGTGESVDPEEFAKYAEPVQSLTIPEGVRVVALGEASHGNSEFQQLKLDVFQLLVENEGVKAFALEGDFGGCEMVNRYIHGGTGTAEEAAANIGFAIYRTDEMAALISYMREYNEKAPKGEDLRFYGFDMQRGLDTYQLLLEECEKLRVSAAKIEPLVTGEDWNPEYDYPQRQARFEQIKALLAAKEGSDLGVHLAEMLIQNCQLNSGEGTSAEYISLRDSFMKENTLWILEQEEKFGRECIFVSGHNGHVEKLAGYGNMGSLLYEELEDDYYVIGTDFYKTTCNLPRGRNGIRTNQTFYSYDPLAKAAKRAWFNICWLDFSKIPEDSSLKQYTADYIYNGSLGEGYNLIIRTIPMSYRVFENPEMAYDSMIYVSEGTPTIIKQAK